MPIAIGTAQFGMKYGVTNTNQPLSDIEILSILQICRDNCIDHIDTAMSYGNAEDRLGQIELQEHFHIDTKITLDKSLIRQDYLQNQLIESLQRLNLNTIDTLYIHNPSSLFDVDLTPLFEWLSKVREQKLIRFIGLSIYDEWEIDLFPSFLVDKVQLPLSIYDQRHLQNGLIPKLKRLGKKVVARSIFLQGLLLTEPKQWPILNNSRLIYHHRKFFDLLLDNNISPLEAALVFTLRNELIDLSVIGISSIAELEQIIKVVNSQNQNLPFISYPDWSWHKRNEIDPRCW